MKYRTLALLIMLVAITNATQAQDPNANAKKDYSIRHWINPMPPAPAAPGVSGAEVQKFMQRLDVITRRIGEIPGFNAPPEKKCQELSVELPSEQPAANPLQATIKLTMYSWRETECLVDDRFVEAGFHLYFNDPQTVVHYPPRPDALGKFHGWKGPLPQPGISQLGNLTVITSPTAPPVLIPVSKERYFNYLLAKAEKQVPKKPGVDPGIVKMMTDAVENLRAQRNALTPAQLAAPVCEQPRIIVNGLDECSVPDFSFVSINPAFINPKLPRSDVQIVTIYIGNIPLYGSTKTSQKLWIPVWEKLVDGTLVQGLLR